MRRRKAAVTDYSKEEEEDRAYNAQLEAYNAEQWGSAAAPRATTTRYGKGELAGSGRGREPCSTGSLKSSTIGFGLDAINGPG
jgi:hypothetical protein